MRWLRILSSAFATKARTAFEGAVSLVPNFFAQVAWQFSSDYLTLATKAFGGNALVYSCLRLLCQSVAEPPLTVYTEAADGELVPVSKEHPLQALIRRPNELMTEYEMLELIELHTGIAGGSWWWKQRTNGGQVAALWPLRPDRIVPAYQPNMDAPEGQRLLRGWAYYPPGGGTPVVIPRSEIIAFGTPDPAGETGGIVETRGWVQVLADEIAADNEATTFVGSLLANYAQPSMLIKTKMPIRDKEVAKRLKAQFMSELGGSHKGEPALLDADTEIEKLSFDLQQLEFPNVRALTETRVSAAAGVPAILVGLKAGLDRSTYSNMEQSREFFTETTLSTKWRRYSDQFTNDLAPEFGDGLVIRFDTSQVKALAGQRQRNAVPIKEGFQGGVVMLDEYREKVLGLPPLPNGAGQVLYVPSNVTVTKPEELLDAKPEPPKIVTVPQNALPPGKPDDEEEDATEEDDAARSFAVKALADDVERRADESRDARSEELAPKIADHLNGQREQAVSHWNERKNLDDWLPDDDADLVRIVTDAWESTLGDAVNDAGKALSVGLSFDLESAWAQEEVGRVGERVKGITTTTRERLQGVVSQAIAEGLSVPDTAKLIREAGAFSEARAETIARTETATAYSSGSLRSYEESGLVDEVEVLDGRDFDEACRALHGQRKSLSWARSNILGHPRCRRAFAPIVKT